MMIDFCESASTITISEILKIKTNGLCYDRVLNQSAPHQTNLCLRVTQ